jgi:hypothetical protein
MPDNAELGKHLELLIRIDERTEQNSEDLSEVRAHLKEQNSAISTHSREIAALKGSNSVTKRILMGVGAVGLLSTVRAFWR